MIHVRTLYTWHFTDLKGHSDRVAGFPDLDGLHHSSVSQLAKN